MDEWKQNKMDEWNNSTYFIWSVWELNEVTKVFVTGKGWHFDPFLHVRQTLYTLPHWHAYFTGEERASEDLRLSRWLSLIPLHMAESLMTVASTCGDLFSWHTNSGRWWLLGSLQQLGSTRLAPCALCSGCSKVSESLGQHVCIPAGRQWEGQSASVSSSGKQTLETSSRFQPPCPWLALCKTPLPGSGEGAADVRNKQYFAFFRIKITFLGWLNFEGKVVCPTL